MRQLRRGHYTILILLICGIVFLSLVGCLWSPPSRLDPLNPVTLTIWHYYNGQQKMIFDEMVAKFNESQGHRKGIVLEAFSQGNVDDLQNKVMDAALGNVGALDMPDMFTAYADNAYEIDQLGLLANIGDYLTSEQVDEYIDSYIGEGRFNNKDEIKIFPVAKATEVLMLNKTDWEPFAKATGACLEDLRTWEGIAYTAEKYYHWSEELGPNSKAGKAFFGRDAMANYILVGSRQLGHEIFVVKDGEVTLNLEEKALRRIWDNFYLPYINGYYKAEGRFRSDDAKTGQIIALVGSTSGIAYFPQKVIIDDIKEYQIEALVLPLPNFKNTPPMAVQQGAGIAVTRSEELREQASIEFLKWFTDVERNIKFSIETGYLPVKKAANKMEAFQEYLSKDIDKAPMKALQTSMPVVLEQLQTYQLYTNKPFKKGTHARQVLTNSLLDKSKLDREKVLTLMEKGINREEAVESFDTEENFQQWLKDLKRDLEGVVR